MLEFHATKQQVSELSGLAYWIADSAYIRERFGDNDPELERIHDTIHFIFDKLDKLDVPFWVQNSVICYAENWRTYISGYLPIAMQKKNIYI